MPGITVHQFDVSLPFSEFPHVPVRAWLRFDSSLPYGVCLSFGRCTPEGSTLDWYFGRDLLSEGRYAPAGDGDVRVRPGGPGRTLIILRTAEREAVISAPAFAVTAFLAESFALVPAGTEPEVLDLDALCARLVA
ncbi:SsgA family sporulation/cell division regulator [Kitasatospora sp. NPDC015120]|uniref:SsgA family sporulation/cell division regulator n=1 Tax=Kitasatospora sp. NPDC015120 TaxID=3364023 RepID=UPI0036F49030